MENVLKNKLKYILELKDKKEKNNEQVMELYIHEMGWIVLLLDDLEIVTDNWFTSTKYLKSHFDYNDSGVFLEIQNVYVKNEASMHTDGNPKYNLMFDQITVFSDQIIACL